MTMVEMMPMMRSGGERGLTVAAAGRERSVVPRLPWAPASQASTPRRPGRPLAKQAVSR